MGFRRPAGAPKILRSIEIKKNGETKKFVFQEIPTERIDEVLDLVISGFLKDEALAVSLDIANDPKEIEIMKKMFKKNLEEGISIGAFDASDKGKKSRLIGYNILVVATKADKEELTLNDLQPKVRTIAKFITDIESSIFHRFAHLGNQYLNAMGLFVHKDYRGLGLAKQILELRTEIAKAYNIPYSVTVFTSHVSQTLAERVGFRDYITLGYDDVVDKDKGEMLFPSLKGKKVKLMIKNFN